MNTFSNKHRQKVTEQLTCEEFDVLVIGGGITGSGIALDAATRGMKTALVEMQDFAAGTSSRSTKLVHGGLRYLKQFEVKMVAEVGKERAVVYENAPHVTVPEWMMLPLHKNGNFGPLSTSIGLRIYDFLAGVKRSERRKMLNREETLKKAPLLKKEKLLGSGYYVEYRTDDARLTIEAAKEAVQNGASLINYTKVTDFLYEDGKAAGVVVEDLWTGETYQIRARKIINAAGPWVDTLRSKDGAKHGKHLRLTKGIHLVFDQSVFPLNQAVYFDTPDGRMVFAIPRDGKTYAGTTDTVYEGDPAHPKMTVEDRQYVLDSINYMFPDVKISVEDVESSWAGLRPLIYEEGKDPSEISRKDEVWEHDSGILTIAGGKLTGYRKMAEIVVDKVSKKLKEEYGIVYQPCQTKQWPLSGGNVGGSSNFKSFVEEKIKAGLQIGLSEQEAESLAKMYGSNVDVLFDHVAKSKQGAGTSPLAPSIYAQVMYAIEEEMAGTLADFFVRRTGALFFNIQWVQQCKDEVQKLMGEELEWSEEQSEKYRTELENALQDAVKPLNEEVKLTS
ncbi:glycerol-3-phosphate dehydrogenase/oxidase [Alteribacillus bidgolensis]|uniref:Glycerol-3-phosphate dehydrogenase n=1 Tax=Alteribacillus bidgolensis TaxID=930129 RepID=A0A1G8I645_9BACI|nr:glycerol-3-phosphate dehydrogenase/oxidase [Alteribacillus bidgolensis]SDI14439.1 homodimeric glycerol 3-phosphate dehydrogenase (quinone) [Alteribacillus bidgolensis]